MKSKAMNRPMFLDVENVGIMQGFKDADEGMGGEYDTGAMLDRTPSSPEILMNNLRGDMRSVDARMEELAQLVGEEAAMETPAEVLALLQPVLASQEGIGSLPAGMPDQSMGSPTPPPSPMGDAMPAPDMGMMPPDMGMPVDVPPGPPPTAQAPLQMAEGGFVQRFREGSDEEGVTPVNQQTPPRAGSAQALLAELAATRDPEALGRNFEQLLPLYQEALGTGDRSMTQSQILFDIAQAGLNLAAGTDAQGKPVRPGASFASSLAGAAQALPERIGARVGQMEQQEQGVRLAALKGAQDEASGQRALEQGVITDFARSDRDMAQKIELANMAYGRDVNLIELRANLERKNAEEEARRKGFGDFFGKSDASLAIFNVPGLIDRWAIGDVTREEEIAVDTAITDATAARTIYQKDPESEKLIPITVRGQLPNAVTEAMRIKGVELPPLPTTETTLTPVLKADGVTRADPVLNEAGKPVSGGFGAPGTELDVYSPTGESFFNLADKGTGPVNITKAWLARNPYLLGLVNAGEQISAQNYLTAGINGIVRSLGETERFGVIEKQQIIDQIGLLPRFFDDPLAFQQSVVGLDNFMMNGITDLRKTRDNKSLPVATRREALAKVDQLRRARNILGAPPRVYSEEDFNAIPIGQPYVTNGVLKWKTRELNEQGVQQ